MKSLLLVITLLSFTVYRAKKNERLPGNLSQSIKEPVGVNGCNETAITALLPDSIKTTAFQKQFKNKA